MKNATKFVGIIVLAAVIGFSFSACKDPTDTTGGDDTHTHSYSVAWSKNATQHWHECGCGDKKDVANHTGGSCTVCGYASGSGGNSMKEAIPLTANQWANGNLPTSSDVQWFSFTATASTQYIHASQGTLPDLHVQVYDSSGTTVGGETYLDSATSTSLSRTLTVGQTYYIRVRPFYSLCGTYKIAFNTSSSSTGITFQLPSNAIPLTENQWEDGNITTAGGEQWFSFTATATTQYIHASFGTLTSLWVQVYDSSGATVGSQTSSTSLSRTLTSGQTYYIGVRTYSDYSGTYRIVFNATFYPPGAIPLTENQWEDGNITTAGGEQWFSFTATASTQYIHVEFGTLESLYVQVYDSSGTAAGSVTYLNSSSTNTNTSRSLTAGQTYYIRVMMSDRSYSGTYRIAFNTSTTAPVQLQPNAIPLTENQWEDGNITTAGGEQWFSFTATASTQYIHAAFGTLTGLYVQVYDSGGAPVESETSLNSSTTRTSRTLTSGQTYYIRVRPYSSSYSGTYRIVFNTSTTAPVQLPSNAIPLTANQWANGNLPTGSDVQWFSFTATASTQYIHVEFGTLTQLYVQVYTSAGATVGAETRLYGSTRSVSRPLTSGQTYYIRVRPYDSSYNGTYRIAFNTSIVPPGTTIIPLTENQWANGSLPTSSSEQWFTFTATAPTQWIHAASGTMNWTSGGINVQVYDSSGNTVGSETRLYSSRTNTSQSLTTGQTFYIRVRPYSSSYSGTYKIGFNALSFVPPGTTIIPLTENVWTDGNLPTSSDVQWFSFTATAPTQWIHASFGTLTDLYVQVYDSSGNTVGSETWLYSSTRSVSRSLTSGQTHYIRVRPYDGSNTISYSGTYRIVFNTSLIPPGISPIPLTANQWKDGNLPTSSDEQWFIFTATAPTQYIHVDLGTLRALYVRVYDSSGATVGSETWLSSSTRSVSRSLTSGQTHYIRVRPSSSYSGTYRIGFNTSIIPPDTNLIPLTANQWKDGNLPTGDGEQWFSFTATASTQYIHADSGTMNWTSGGINVQVYDSSGATVGSETRLYSSTLNTSRSLTSGQTYYIRVRPSDSSYSGTYRIGFNTTFYPPGTTIIPLTANQWKDGNLPTSSDEQWFSFTATASTQWIHVDLGTLRALYVQVYDSSGATVGSETWLGSTRSVSRSLTSGQTHYIRVRPPDSGYSGTYRIGFNTTIYPPGTTIIPLTANQWKDGNFPTSSDEQWFSFTATASTQYIHAAFGTPTDLWVGVYDSSGTVVGGGESHLQYATSLSRTLTIGDTYYIRVGPSGNKSGTYRIAFNTSSTAPTQ